MSMCKKNMCLISVILVLFVGLAGASTVWNPAGNGIYPPDTGDWGVAANWTNGVPGTDPCLGEVKAVFNVADAAECVVTDAQTFQDLVQGDNGAADAGVVRVQNGGNLTTTGGWAGIGYNRQAKMAVETGGVFNCGGHLWVGQQIGGIGTLELAGGTVNGAGNFSLGWNGGTGYANINDGVLNLSYWAGADAIKGASLMDIEAGSVIIGGSDQTGNVASFIAAGKITAYDGTGTVVYDYNVTNPGKTTITATEGEIVADWHVASTIYPTDDTIVTPYYAADFGIVGDGTTDVTDAIQAALISISNLGGGALFLPAGNYKVSGNLTIPAMVTLRGDWLKPVIGNPVAGTILQAYAGRDDENAAPFIELSGSSGVNGITIWYPEQLPTDIRPYPPTIHGGGATVENVTFVNSYIGFTTYVEGTTARPFMRHIYGTPLKTGIEYDCLADIGRMETVHFSPDYWADSGLANAPTAGEHESWIYNNGTGMIVRRIDWSYSCYVTVEGYNIGLALRPGRWDSNKYPNGQSYMFTLNDCKTGIYIEASAYAGYQFTRFDIQGAETGVYLGVSAIETDMFNTCSINASGDAIFSEGAAKVLMMSCDIQQGTVDIDGGYLSVINSDFGATATNHIELASGVNGASILGNTFTGGAQIVNNTAYPVTIDHTPLAVDPMPAYNYKKPTTEYNAAKDDLFVVTESPYNAQADGVTDDTAAFQAALADADTNGGGIVVVPGGTYRIDGNLTVPTGVELRGVFDIPHSTSDKGSLLNVYAGRNNAGGTPFIQIESGAGIRGLNFHYPEQIYDEFDDDPVTGMYGMVPYPFLIRGLGSDVYVLNIAATIPYQLLDLATYQCDDHYIDYIFSTALKTGIHVGNGAVDGQIHNCQFNPSAYTHQSSYYESIPSGTSDDIHKILWRDATPYLFGDISGEVLHENFVFGGMKGVHLVEEGGFGPSGYCMGMGVDQCTNAMQIDDIGSGGLDMINSQIVTVNGTAGRYLETGASFDDTFRMFGSAGWGTHQYSAVINGGDVRLQLFHLARDGESGAFQVNNDASLQNLGGNLTDYLALGRPFLTIDSTATAEFIGNIINTAASQMPDDSLPNVTATGNLRVGAPPTTGDSNWTNAGDDRLWRMSANWSNGVPTSANKAGIRNDSISGPIIDSSTTALALNIVVGDWGSTADSVDMTGGSLTVGGWLILGYGTVNDGTFTISAGTAGTGGNLFVGYNGAGTVDMTGGSLTVGSTFGIAQNTGSTGDVFLDGGTISSGSINMTSGGAMDITTGTLIVNGDVTSTINGYISSGWITGYGGSGTLNVDYDTSNPGKTTVTATASGWTQIQYDDFEGGYGNWNDGGSDCKLYTKGTYAHQGNNAVDLEDNTSSSLTTTDNLALAAYDEVKVDFWYYPRSMDNSNEDFWLQISTNGGSSFDTIEEWNLGDEFENDNFYPDSVIITGYTLTNQTQLRFRCDASGGADDVYIDEILVSAQ